MIGGAKAGHGDAGDVGPGKMHQVHGLACGQQRQGGIQSAEIPTVTFPPVMRRRRARAVACRSKIWAQRACRKPCPRNEGMLGHMQPGLHMVGQLRAGQATARMGSGRHSAPPRRQRNPPPAGPANAVQVQVGGEQIVLSQVVLIFRHGRATLGNQAMAGEHQVGGGLADSCRNIDIAAQATGGLLVDQRLPVLRLAISSLLADRFTMTSAPLMARNVLEAEVSTDPRTVPRQSEHRPYR